MSQGIKTYYCKLTCVPFGGDRTTMDAHRISIENSKYLGGDVEHTHLVKGLDYALLHKVRSEIDTRPDEEEDEEDAKRRLVGSHLCLFLIICSIYV